jgi:hypothetical protein
MDQYYFVIYQERILFVEKSFWDNHHHVGWIGEQKDLLPILPEGFSRSSESGYDFWEKNQKKTKKGRKLLKQAGFTEVFF